MPTVAELAAQGLARQVVGGYTVTSEGHDLLGAVMARNGERNRKWRAR